MRRPATRSAAAAAALLASGLATACSPGQDSPDLDRLGARLDKDASDLVQIVGGAWSFPDGGPAGRVTQHADADVACADGEDGSRRVVTVEGRSDSQVDNTAQQLVGALVQVGGYSGSQQTRNGPTYGFTMKSDDGDAEVDIESRPGGPRAEWTVRIGTVCVGG